uniref:Uncharacterized protein n=1 Tax=Macaca fascicularis TaxID=9541 RepID=A0A7N9CW98_MACFA
MLDAQPDSEDHGCSQTQARLDEVLLPGIHDPPPLLGHVLLPQLGHQPAPVHGVLAAVSAGVRAGAVLPPVAAARQPRSASPRHSSTDSARFMQRPLLFVASWRHSSARRTKKVFLSTFQSEAEPQSKSQPLNLESLEPNSGTKPADSAAENGFQEHEV